MTPEDFLGLIGVYLTATLVFVFVMSGVLIWLEIDGAPPAHRGGKVKHKEDEE